MKKYNKVSLIEMFLTVSETVDTYADMNRELRLQLKELQEQTNAMKAQTEAIKMQAVKESRIVEILKEELNETIDTYIERSKAMEAKPNSEIDANKS